MPESRALLESLSSALDALQEILSTQTAALRGNDADALAELIRSQEGRVADVMHQWSALTDALCLPQPPSRGQIEEALPLHADAPLKELWGGILAKAEAAEQANRLNGRLIDEQLRRTRSALQVLQGASDQRALYGSDGRTLDLFTPNRSIDEA